MLSFYAFPTEKETVSLFCCWKGWVAFLAATGLSGQNWSWIHFSQYLGSAPQGCRYGQQQVGRWFTELKSCKGISSVYDERQKVRTVTLAHKASWNSLGRAISVSLIKLRSAVWIRINVSGPVHCWILLVVLAHCVLFGLWLVILLLDCKTNHQVDKGMSLASAVREFHI